MKTADLAAVPASDITVQSETEIQRQLTTFFVCMAALVNIT